MFVVGMPLCDNSANIYKYDLKGSSHDSIGGAIAEEERRIAGRRLHRVRSWCRESVNRAAVNKAVCIGGCEHPRARPGHCYCKAARTYSRPTEACQVTYSYGRLSLRLGRLGVSESAKRRHPASPFCYCADGVLGILPYNSTYGPSEIGIRTL
jgi:hypothetical protein